MTTTNEKLNFTHDRLTKFAAQEGRGTLWDGKQPGLLIERRKTASTFYLYKWLHGKATRIKLGRWPVMTISDARTRAAELMAEIGKGENPAAERRKTRAITLGRVWEAYLPAAKAHKQEKSIKEEIRQWEKHLKPWSGRKLADITSRDIGALHTEIGTSHKVQANRVRALISQLFTHATREMGFDKKNPCNDVKPFDEQSRERYLSETELPRFLAALDTTQHQDFANVFLICLLTAVRINNVLSMKWSQLDLDASIPVWRIPRTKNGQPHEAPLHPRLVAMLKARSAISLDKEWVFPSRSKSGHLANPYKAWEDVLTNSQITDLTPHDLRRTLTVALNKIDCNAYTIKRLLTQGKPSKRDVTEIYARVSLETAAEKLFAAIDNMLGNCPPPPLKAFAG